MQTLRKKSSPCKYKNEPSRFLGDGVSFKAKLIGILEVSEARGDRMCQEALADLKMAIRAAGEHKQRITINIAIDGLRLRDEKTGDSLYHHPVHKISFIAQDMSDSRAFGYIFGSPDTGHRFFGIKTDKAASQVVIAMRDLFQVVFELKKKEIELAKQHIEQKSRFSSSAASSLFADSAISSSKSYQNGSDSTLTSTKLASVSETSTSKHHTDTASSRGASASAPPTSNESAIADLVDLELELNSIQQGIHQMERITPSDPFGPGGKEDPFGNSDPFGDSFTSFPQKPFLPPPPSGGRDRTSRTTTTTTTSSDSNSLFSPKTPKTTAGSSEPISISSSITHEPSTTTATSTTNNNFIKTTSSNDDQSSCDWFTPTGGTDSLFEDSLETVVKEPDGATTTNDNATAPPAAVTTTKESNASILSQFDVFTELDPLGTGRKPGGGPTDTTNQFANFETSEQPTTSNTPGPFHTTTTTTTNFVEQTTQHQSQFLLQQNDPFAFGDPFDKTDPFGAEEFPKEHDPFDTDFVVGDFKLFDKAQTDDKYNNKPSPSPNSTKDNKKPVFVVKEDNNHKLQPLFLSPLSKSPNRNLDRQMSLASSTSPRANAQLSKQNTFDTAKFTHYDQKFSKLNHHQLHENPSLDMSSESEVAPEPPPRPASNITPIKPPPLPPKKQPFDLSKKPPPRPPHTEESHYDYMESYETGLNSLDHFDSPPLPVPARKSRFDSEFVPQRPKKQLPHHSSDEDYLTPNPPKKDNLLTGPILLPPPQKPSKRGERAQVAPETKPPEDTLDITLSQLTLSGLNELAQKLKIPPAQLSNMTLVQLTNYLSNYVENSQKNNEEASDATYPTFQADFSSNFNDLNQPTTKSEPYDRYAVFRELLQQDPPKKVEPEEDTPPEPLEITTQEDTNQADRYAALREIIIEENEVKGEPNEEEIEQKINNINQKIDEIELNVEPSIIELELEKLKTPPKSPILLKSPPIKSPILSPKPKSPNLTKSPVPSAITEIITQNNHSGSVSDVISNSSPEIDNTSVSKKNEENTTRESWAIFDTPNHRVETKVQSEEGVSPWSSDSKEFGNGSPSDWQQRRDSGSEGDWTRQRRRKDTRDGSWWDNQGEIGGHYEKPPRATYPRERRSTDSYDDEWYEPDRPRRRTRPSGSSAGGGGGGTGHTWNKGAGAGGGQSSSSRDVSPWEEEEQPRTGPASVSGRREECWPPPPCSRRSRGPSWDRHRRRDDSWDEEDDYEYENEYMSKFHWPEPRERHGSRDSDRASRDSDRHSGSREPPDHWDTGGGDQWNEDRRHMRRRGHPPDDRWCRPDWDHENEKVCGTKEKVRYGGSSSRWPGNQDSGKWRGERERKRDSDTRYYKRDHSQESPWEDDYSNDPDESPHSPRYLPARRNWKRPSSASEMDRKSGEIKQRQPYCLSAGGSDGERDRKYRTNRRSRSRDSQFTDIPHRHKIDSLTLGRYRNRDKYNQMFDDKEKLDAKKSQTLGRQKKTKELLPPPSPKIENDDKRKAQFKFENDFVNNSETDSPLTTTKNKFNFENDFETSEAESPVNRYAKSPRNDFKRNVESSSSSLKPFKNDLSDRESTSKSPITLKQTSLFEDDFSPTEKPPDGGITAIAEEETEPRVTFTENNLDKSTPDTRKQKNLSKTRMGLCNIRADANLKKSESVNIFARENDPFDDDFFSGRENIEVQNVDNVIVVASPNVAADFKWTEDFDSFDMLEENNK